LIKSGAAATITFAKRRKEKRKDEIARNSGDSEIPGQSLRRMVDEVKGEKGSSFKLIYHSPQLIIQGITHVYNPFVWCKLGSKEKSRGKSIRERFSECLACQYDLLNKRMCTDSRLAYLCSAVLTLQ